jgi:hypothetical protein
MAAASSGDVAGSGRALPFIMPGNGGTSEETFELGEEAMSVLQSIEVPVIPIAICGKARTGKSYLLNSFLRRAPVLAKSTSARAATGSFSVGATVESCTKGIWLYSEPIFIELDDGSPAAILVLDTEGFGDQQRAEEYDARVFAMATLLCSVLVYNSSGVVNNDAIASLSFVAKMSKHIQVRTSSGSDASDEGAAPSFSDPDELAALFPSFVWVLRDFHLILVDADGMELTPRDYMEQRLSDDGKLDDESRRRNGVRRAITTFFRERDCHSLMLPVEEEEQLQRLEELADDELREGFVKGRDELVRKLLQPPLMKVKRIGDHDVTGRMLAGLAKSYVAAVNDNGVPSVGSAWDAVTGSECREAEAAGRVAAKEAEAEAMAELPVSDEEEAAIASRIRDAAAGAFAKRALGAASKAHSHAAAVDEAADAGIERVLAANEEAAIVHCRRVLASLRETVIAPRLAGLRAHASAAATATLGAGATSAATVALPASVTAADVEGVRREYVRLARGPSRVLWREAEAFWAELLPEVLSVLDLSREAAAAAREAGLRGALVDARAAALRAEAEVETLRSRAGAAEDRADRADAESRQLRAAAEARSSAATTARKEAAAARDLVEDAEARAAAAEKAVFEERARRRAAEAAADEAAEAQEAAQAELSAVRAEGLVTHGGGGSPTAPPSPAFTAGRVSPGRVSLSVAGGGGGGGGGRGGGGRVTVTGKDADEGPRRMEQPALRPTGAPRLGAPADADAIAAASKVQDGCCVVM